MQEVIKCFQGAASMSSQGIGNAAYAFGMLAYLLYNRYERVGDPADLDDAINANHKALELTPSAHPNRSHSLMSLANALWSRFKQVGDRTDLENAITNILLAVKGPRTDTDIYKRTWMCSSLTLLNARSYGSSKPKITGLHLEQIFSLKTWHPDSSRVTVSHGTSGLANAWLRTHVPLESRDPCHVRC